MGDCIYYRWNSGYYCDLKYEQTDNGDIDGDRCNRYCWSGRYDECNYWKTKQNGSGGCFLTSACVQARQLPDNCLELETLRKFRDGYLRSHPGGDAEIEEYYAVAPTIVDAINKKENAIDVWNRIYDNLIVPCVKHIQKGENESAHTLYRKAVIDLKALYAE